MTSHLPNQDIKPPSDPYLLQMEREFYEKVNRPAWEIIGDWKPAQTINA